MSDDIRPLCCQRLPSNTNGRVRIRRSPSFAAKLASPAHSPAPARDMSFFTTLLTELAHSSPVASASCACVLLGGAAAVHGESPLRALALFVGGRYICWLLSAEGLSDVKETNPVGFVVAGTADRIASLGRCFVCSAAYADALPLWFALAAIDTAAHHTVTSAAYGLPPPRQRGHGYAQPRYRSPDADADADADDAEEDYDENGEQVVEVRARLGGPAAAMLRTLSQHTGKMALASFTSEVFLCLLYVSHPSVWVLVEPTFATMPPLASLPENAISALVAGTVLNQVTKCAAIVAGLEEAASGK